MLAALSRLRGAAGFALWVAHVEHGIRPVGESRGDAEAVKALCAGLGLPCRVLRLPPGKAADYSRRWGTGLEAAARHYRYRLLCREALRRGAGIIVVAHTADDALELCLMRILRGSGPAGLRRMPPSRSFFEALPGGSLRVARPLLSLCRADVEAYLRGRGIPWRNDSTNTDTRYLRNRVRSVLVPLLDQSFPGWKGGLESLGGTQALAADFIDAEARRRVAWERAGGAWGKTGSSPLNRGEELRCGGDIFFGEAPIIREEALFQALDMLGLPRAATVKRRNLRRFARGEIRDLDLGFCRITLDGGGYVSVFRRKRVSEAGFSLLIKEPGLYKLGRSAGWGTGAGGTVLFKVSGPLSARPREAGDRLGEGERPGFFTSLPLLLRPALPDDAISQEGPAPVRNSGAVAAQDAAGIAAFIGFSPAGAEILRQRGALPGGELFFCDIGGIDA
jgi:tRNA(Ile)-lysidine synthase